MIVDCDQCEMQGTHHCKDCIVTALLEPDREGAIVFDVEEERAVRAMAVVGLVPEIRMRRRTTSAGSDAV